MAYPAIVRKAAQAKYGPLPGRLSPLPAPRLVPAEVIPFPRHFAGVRLKDTPVNAADILRRLERIYPEFGKKIPKLPERIPLRIPKLPLGAAVDAVQIIGMMLPVKYKLEIPDGLIMDNGPWLYPYPYNGAPQFNDPNTTFDRPLRGQYHSKAYGLHVPPGLDPFGVWIPSDINPAFGAHYATFRHIIPATVDLTGFEMTTTREIAQPGESGVSLVPGTYIAPSTSPNARPYPPPYWALPQQERDPLSEVGYGESITGVAAGVRPGGDPYIRGTISPTRSPTVKEGVKPRADEPGAKERKATIRTTYPVLHGIVGGFTEGLDALAVAHKSLPPQYQAKPKKGKDGKWHASTPQDKLGALYDHWDKVDIGTLIGGLIAEHAEDKAYGRTNAAIDKGFKGTYKQWGGPRGVSWGPAL